MEERSRKTLNAIQKREGDTVKSMNKKIEYYREAMTQTFYDHIVSVESSLREQFENLKLNNTSVFNGIWEKLHDLKENVLNMTNHQQDQLDELVLNVKSLSEKQAFNRNDLSNLTYFYSELVELSKSYLNMDNLNDPETSKQLMKSLEAEMFDLQKTRIQEAITKYDSKLKPYINKRDDETKEVMSRIQTNLDLLMPELPEFLREWFIKENVSDIRFDVQKILFFHYIYVLSLTLQNSPLLSHLLSTFSQLPKSCQLWICSYCERSKNFSRGKGKM